VTAADLGLFGPGSVSWRIHGDPSVAAAEVRAVLLRLLYPGAVLHRDHPKGEAWGQALRAAEYVMTTTFGTTKEANRAAARATGLMRPIPGIDPDVSDEDGSAAGSDHELIRWVHCCNVDSYLTVARRSGLHLEDVEADAYVAEQVRSAELLGLPRDSVPSSTAALQLYFERMKPQLDASREAKQAAAALLWPRISRWIVLGTPARPIWISMTTLGFALLPAWARRMYGFPGLPTTDAAASAAVWSLRVAMRAVPRRVREAPQVSDAKRRVAATPVMRLDSFREHPGQPAPAVPGAASRQPRGRRARAR